MRMTRLHHCYDSARRTSVVRFLGFAAAAVLLLFTPPVRASVLYWNADWDDWSVGADWTYGAVPTSSDYAEISNDGTATVTTPGDVCNALLLGDSSGAGYIQMTDGSLTTQWLEIVGYQGDGDFEQFGGTNTVSTEALRGLELRQQRNISPRRFRPVVRAR